MRYLNIFISSSKLFLEKLDRIRDKILFVFIKLFWPRFITPNHLTFLRVAIAIILFVLLFYYNNSEKFIILSLFFVGVFSDLLDGSIARALNMETKVGAMLDPVADRILILPIAFYILISSHKWLLLFLILLETINGLMSLYAQGRNIFIESNIFGKFKMVLQSIFFLTILVFWPKTPNIFFINMLWFSAFILIISIYVKANEIKGFLNSKNEK